VIFSAADIAKGQTESDGSVIQGTATTTATRIQLKVITAPKTK
jgi:hypothetical protein